MNSIIRIMCCLVLFSLFGCAQLYQPHSPAIAECKASCLMRFEFCKKECVNNCPNCATDAYFYTLHRYEKYLCQEEIQGGIIMRELQSYRDPLQCRKTTCNCSADLSICTQSCTGVISKQLRATPFCT